MEEYTSIKCLLPNKSVQQFLIELINQSSFQGNMSNFITEVKQLLAAADIQDSK